jgi:hypothetical protein
LKRAPLIVSLDPAASAWPAKVVERSATPNGPDFGFIRELAVLLVVIVTDEDDCSYTPGWESICLASNGFGGMMQALGT